MMMISTDKQFTKVFVVDPRPQDYAGIAPETPGEEPLVRTFANGRAALWSDPALNPSYWVVNVRLPDMAGTDLLSMLRWRYPGIPIVLVSDDWQTADEIQARRSGADLYFSKPLQIEWLKTALTETDSLASSP